MKQPSNFALDLTIGALFLIGLSFLLSYMGIRTIFPEGEVSKAFMIMGIIMSIGSLSMLYYFYKRFFSIAKVDIRKHEKINEQDSVKDTLSWLEQQGKLQEPSPAYLALVITVFSIISIVIWLIISQL